MSFANVRAPRMARHWDNEGSRFATDAELTDEVREALAFLRSNFDRLPADSKDFASKVLAHWATPKMLAWAPKLADRIRKPQAPAQVDVGSFSGVIDLFKTAAQNKRHPKLHLRLNGAPLVLSVAGEQSRRPGTVNLTDGKPFGDNVWFGRVTPEGAFEPARGVSEATRQAIVTILRDLARDPVAFATAFGQDTGVCCFCNKTLDGKDGVSVALGFGPVCAKKFGLSWGKRAQAAKLSCEAA